MRLIHEKECKCFQQAVWQDDESELYYEIVRVRGVAFAEIFISPELHPSKRVPIFNEYGEICDTTPIAVFDDHEQGINRMFDIRKGERWKKIKGNLLSYIMRASLGIPN